MTKQQRNQKQAERRRLIRAREKQRFFLHLKLDDNEREAAEIKLQEMDYKLKTGLIGNTAVSK